MTSFIQVMAERKSLALSKILQKWRKKYFLRQIREGISGMTHVSIIVWLIFSDFRLSKRRRISEKWKLKRLKSDYVEDILFNLLQEHFSKLHSVSCNTNYLVLKSRRNIFAQVLYDSLGLWLIMTSLRYWTRTWKWMAMSKWSRLFYISSNREDAFTLFYVWSQLPLYLP